MEETRFTNNTGIPLSVAVWLCEDTYDYVDEPNYISVTTLMKSPRQIILGMRSSGSSKETPDIADRMASKFGTAIHSSIESAWLNDSEKALQKLGYPLSVIQRIRINPEPEDLTPTTIPIYMEKRAFQKIGLFTIGGKFDFVGQGILEDFKTTGVWSYMSGSNEWKYKLQGSLYRWLNPKIITNDYMNIQFIFTDWAKHEAKSKADKGYPPTRMFQHKIELTSLPETHVWVKNKVALLESLISTPEPELPLCDAVALWQEAPTFKYYKNPAKTDRSTKNFTTSAEAQIRWIEDGCVGSIVEVPGTAKGCLYCDAFNLCSQKDLLIANGTLRA